MMKIMNMAIVLFCFSLIALPVFAAEGGEKGASEEAFEHASEQSVFHRAGDWFATVGKSPEEKEQALQKRREMRDQKRIEKEARKSVKEMEKQKEKEKVKVKVKDPEKPEKNHGKGKSDAH
jgi:hypothetical protein